MLEIIKKHPRYAFGALLVHIFFLSLFVVGFHFQSDERAATTQAAPTVKVNTVDEKLVQKELRHFKQQDEQARLQRDALIKQRKAEEKRLADLRAQRLAEQKQEQQRIALAAQQAAEKEKRRKQKEAAEKKRKLAEQKRKEQERKQREAEQQRIQAQNDAAFKKQLEAEAKQMQQQQEIAAQRRAALKAKQTEIDKYKTFIENKIYQNWVMPPNTAKGLVCVLEVTLIPTGDVISVEVSKSSGDSVYDKSVVAAVRRASPLPVPPAQANLFDEFRNLTLPIRSDKKS